MANRYFDIYAEAAVVTGTETVYLRDDMLECVLDLDMTSVPFLTLVVANPDGLYSGEIFSQGDEITFYLAQGIYVDEDSHAPSEAKIVFAGQIYDIEFGDDELTLKCQPVDARLVGAKITETFYGGDVASSVRDVVQRFVAGVGYNYIIDTYTDLDESMSFKSEIARFVIPRLANFADHSYYIRPEDKELILLPSGYGLNFIDSWTAESTGQSSNNFNVKAGTWEVSSHRYYQKGTSVDAVSIAKWQGSEIISHLGDYLKCKMESESGGSDTNAYFIFDYVSSSNFKFAGMDAANDYWRIGHYDGAWNYDASAAGTINTGTVYEVEIKLELSGASACKVTFYADGVEKTNYTFAGGLSATGKIGLGSKGGAKAYFDEYASYSSGLFTLVEDDIEDYKIKRDMMRMGNRAEVIGGNEAFEDDFSKDLGRWGDNLNTCTISIVSEACRVEAGGNWDCGKYSTSRVTNMDFSGRMKILSTGSEQVGIVRLRDDKNDSYYQAEFSATADTIVLKKVVAGSPTTLGTVSKTIAPDTWYKIGMKAFENNISVYFSSDTAKYLEKALDKEDADVGTGYLVIGAHNSNVEFDDVSWISDRTVTAAASDNALISLYGVRVIGPISDSSLTTKEQALSKADYILGKNKLEQTRGSLILSGRTDFFLGDVINLDIPDADIETVDYRIIRLIQKYTDSEGFTTELIVAENIREIEDILINLTRETFAGASYLQTVIPKVINASDTLSSLTDSAPTTTLRDITTTSYVWGPVGGLGGGNPTEGNVAEWGFSTWGQ